jgi:hypothetical protein
MKYKNEDYVSEKLAPEFPVVKASDVIWSKGKQNFLIQNTASAPGVKAKMNGFLVNTNLSYICQLHKFADILDTQTADNQDAGLKLETSKVDYVTDVVLLRKEYDDAAIFSAPANYATGNSATLTASQQWDDYTGGTSSSDPAGDIKYAKRTVHKKIFKECNTMIVSRDVHDVLTEHPKIKDRYKYTNSASITEEMLAKYFEIANYVVAKSGYNTAAEDVSETWTPDYIWSKICTLAYVNPNPGLDTITFALTFRQKGYRKIRSWFDNDRDAVKYEVQDNYQTKILIPEAGFLYKSVIS